MDKFTIKQLLEEVKAGTTPVDKAYKALQDLPFQEMGYATIDHHREIRTGYPEVIFSEGKTAEHLAGIVGEMMRSKTTNILATRASEQQYEAVKEICPEAVYTPLARTITLEQTPLEKTETYIAVITAGTSDIPVAEEAAITAGIFGNKVVKINDVGVAGIHRFYAKLDIIKKAKVCVVVAGMEGALPSFVGGQVNMPVIGVPTSVGYGANFNGLAALLGMLNSCASGVSVVNIDNGFGAGFLASMINKI